jgi:ABC-type transport system involved in multi-copper enzyme maturation permease subunit
MTFLPIVVRELSLASRRRATFWTRMVFAGVAVVVATFTLLYVGLLQSRPGLGAGVFRMLSGLGFAFCAVAGVFLTADCLSEEKREGTLGLLFLTDLRGYDVVLGKLFARSLTACYGVFALFPVLALSLTLGGVTAGELWRMMLVCLNALFLSLTTGMLVSVLSRKAQRAITATALLVLAIVVLPPLLHHALSIGSARVPASVLSFSPLWGWTRCLDAPYRAQPGDFWRCVVAVQALSWTWLLLAAVLLPRVWQEGRLSLCQRATMARLRPAALARRARQRGAMMAPNPIRWLAQRASLPVWGWWLGFAALVGLCGVLTPLRATAASAVDYTGWALAIALRGVVAIEAGRFFVEARQTGALELLLCAPLAPGQLVDGPWRALIRRFWFPALIVMLIQARPVILALVSTSVGLSPGWLWSGMVFAWSVMGLLLDLGAIAWVGMWLGLSVRRPGRVAGYTVLWMVLLPQVVPCLAGITFLLDLPLMLWARGRLHRELRSIAIRPYAAGLPPLRTVPGAPCPPEG